MKADRRNRRRFLARSLGFGASGLLAGCDRLSQTTWFPRVLESAESLNRTFAKTLGRRAMAQEFERGDLSPEFRSNGTSDPGTDAYNAMVANRFADWRLEVAGLVQFPRAYSLAELRKLPSRTQITRHDCVEGWSAIGEWKGARLKELLAEARPTSAARYVVFHCMDALGSGGDLYYESIDLDDANHVQTILAYDLNGQPLPVANGAPLRLRVERQLGYKHAKYVTRLEVVERLDGIGGGKGGYWEDRGYQWYAGI